MSYNYPTADVNSAGDNPDPITGVRLERADDLADRMLSRPPNYDSFSPFYSWQRFTEDVLHYRRFEDLPREQRDAIRRRRRKAFKDSNVPWIVNDLTAMLTAYDDVDDLLKTGRLLKDYGLTPAARAVRDLRAGRRPFADENLEGWRAECDAPVSPRERKLGMLSFGGLNLLAQLGTAGLGALFPSWRLASLLLQAAQTSDMLFGVGLQLGPILGYAMESFFRGAKDTLGPIFDFDSKFEQLKAARIIQRAPRIIAGMPYAHPDDALTSLTGLWYASDRDILPRLVIDTADYPDLGAVFDDFSQAGAQAFNAGRLAASLPYNLGALFVNDVLNDVLGNWSDALGGGGNGALPEGEPDNAKRTLMLLAEAGICPTAHCEAELALFAGTIANVQPRVLAGQAAALTRPEIADNLGFSTEEPEPYGVITPRE